MDKPSELFTTEYGVISFIHERRKLKPLPALSASRREGAIRLGERLARDRAGVVVFERRVAPQLGEWDDPVVLAIHGEVPPEFAEGSSA